MTETVSADDVEGARGSWPAAFLDLQSEGLTEQERDGLLTWYVKTHGVNGNLDLLKFVLLLVEFSPNALKGYWRYVTCATDGSGEVPLPPVVFALLYLHYYVVVGYANGIIYEMVTVRKWGGDKAQVIEALNWAFLEAGPRGLNAAAELSFDYLRDWDDDPGTATWPAGWSRDTQLLASGLDFATDSLTTAELESLYAWHQRVHGTVPASVQLLATHHPKALKARRNRYEHALGRALPVQMGPLCTLHVALIRANAVAVELSARECLAFGVSADEMLQVAEFAWIYGGQTAMDVGAPVLRDVLDAPRGGDRG